MKNIKNNTELNKQIFIVCTTQFKKDAKATHEYVERAGFKISKWGGSFKVEDPKTYRWIGIEECRDYRGTFYYIIGGAKGNIRKNPDVVQKFDFANCIITPRNTAYRNVLWADERPTITKYNKIVYAKDRVKYDKEEIERIQKEINKLQFKLQLAIESKVKEEIKLNEVRKELGL